MAVTDPYAVLGVPRDATSDQIRTAYRKLARQYHPDVNRDDPGAEEKFKEVSEAYSILSDADKRARFDNYGVTDDQPGAGSAADFMSGGGFADIFEQFFGAAGGGHQRNRRPGHRDGDDLRAETVVTLREVLTGVERTLRYKRERVCRSCGGNGTADGSAPPTCPNCNGSGVVVRVAQTLLGSMRTQTTCPTCQGSGQKISDPCKTCHGRKTEVSDAEVSITVPPGVESGMTLRASGQGNDGLGGGHTGDLYVVVHVSDDSRF
ncbi:MAG: J domain-containing protein, partial [Fimbriimonadaceae bacterium]|nr:J domain-containing protein [Fimbriimonadaceae bacterium]